MCVCIWLIHFAARQTLTQHCKAIILQFKKNQGKNRIVTVKAGNLSIYPVCTKVLNEKMV